MKSENLVDTEPVMRIASFAIHLYLVGSITGPGTFCHETVLNRKANAPSGRRPNDEENNVLRVERGNQNVRRIALTGRTKPNVAKSNNLYHCRLRG